MSPITETIRRPIGTLLVLVFLSCPWPTQAADDSPIPVVEVFHEALLATMKDAEALGVVRRLREIIWIAVGFVIGGWYTTRFGGVEPREIGDDGSR